MNRVREDEPWPDTVRTGGQRDHGREPVSREELLAPSTQVVADRDAYLGQGQHDVGRRISDDQVELFVTGDAAPSLQRELELHASEFIAVHDIGASASLRLLAGLAGAAHATVQKLTIRRQGYGLALAVLQFVEVPLSAGGAVRVYSTEASADGPTRQALSRTLLAHSRLGVLITGEVPQHTVAAALQPLREAIARGPWTNQELLIVPLGSSGALAAQAAALSAGTSVAVQITPQAIKPKHIWTFVAGAWNRLNGASGSARAVEADIERAVPRPATPRSEAATQPGSLPPSFAPTVQAGLRPPSRRRACRRRGRCRLPAARAGRTTSTAAWPSRARSAAACSTSTAPNRWPMPAWRPRPSGWRTRARTCSLRRWTARARSGWAPASPR
jgi:hypothetical protein